MRLSSWYTSRAGLAITLVASILTTSAHTASAAAPAIRISASNQVPDCVTPDRLMQFLQSRNPRLNPRFQKIAEWYKYHGESWQVRWDYAFYQMALETNFLSYRRPNGKRGDVRANQNNFAGIGTTGGGVPGNNFPDVSTGVLAQIQHLVAYSGERVTNPVAQRTRAKQHIILKGSAKVARRRPVTFQDLSGRWAVDRKYGRSIEHLARKFRQIHCGSNSGRVANYRTRIVTPPSLTPALARPPQRIKNPANQAKRSRLQRPNPQVAAREVTVQQANQCSVDVASYGGNRTVLIKSRSNSHLKLTALDVDPRYETELSREYILTHAQGGKTIASYGTRAEALVRAHAMCDEINGQG